MKSRLISGFLAVALVSAAGLSVASAQTIIVGERIEFSPATPRPGETVTVTGHFRIEGAPVNLGVQWIVKTEPAAPAGPPPPTVVTGLLNPGGHTLSMRYTVPSPPPATVRFDLKLGDRLIIADASLETVLRAAGTGRGERIVSTPAAAPAAAPGGAPQPKPDLIIRAYFGTRTRTEVGPFFVPIIYKTKYLQKVTIQNIGRGATSARDHLHAVMECKVGADWLPFATTTGNIPPGTTLAPGQEISIKFASPGRPGLPAGTTGLRYIVDPGSRIDEANEDNNIYEYK